MCYTIQQIALSSGEISGPPTRLAGLTVDLAGLRGVLWHRFGLGGGAENGSMMCDEVLRLRGAEVRRDAAILLRNVDWTAHGDECWILNGPNGAVKSTLLTVAGNL